LKAVSCLPDKGKSYGYETAKPIKKRVSAGKRLKVTFQQFQRSASPTTSSRTLRSQTSITEIETKDSDTIQTDEDKFIKTTTPSQKKTEGGKGGGGGGGGKLDKLPEYLRETVDWFMGKARRRGDKGDGSGGDGEEQKLYLQEPLLETRVPPEPDLTFLTDLPGGLDFNEWLASHTIGFFEHVNLIYGTVSEYCTQSTCPDMVGPGPRQYLWQDEKGKKLRLSASQYIDYIMTYCQKTINDESVFPTKHGNEFPSNFEATYIRKVFRLLFHVIAHVYHAHFREIVLLQLHAHLNALFAHFVGFSYTFSLVEEKELEVLGDLIVALKIIPIQPQESASTANEPLDNSVLEGTSSEENKENNPVLSTASHIPDNHTTIISDIPSTELHSDASNSSSRENENMTDHPVGNLTDQSSQNIQSDSGSSPMEGVEEGTCNGCVVDTISNDNPESVKLNNVTRMSTNSQVDMNLSDTECSEKD